MYEEVCEAAQPTYGGGRGGAGGASGGYGAAKAPACRQVFDLLTLQNPLIHPFLSAGSSSGVQQCAQAGTIHKCHSAPII